MGDKASGVYLTLTDNSIVANGSVQLAFLIPMLTTKGELGLNTVTANDFKEILGFDRTYNSNYIGLQNILENVSYAKVWRLNQNAKLGNAYFDKNGEYQSDADCDNFKKITSIDDIKLAAANLNVGNPGEKKIRFIPSYDVLNIANSLPTQTNPQVMTIDDVSETEKEIFPGAFKPEYVAVESPSGSEIPSAMGWYEKTADDSWYKLSHDSSCQPGKTYYIRNEVPVEIYSGCKFYDSTDEILVGVIKDNWEGEKRIYRVVDGIINDDVEDKETGTWTDNSRGTAEWDSDFMLTAILTAKLSSDTFYTLRIIKSIIENWRVQIADKNEMILDEVSFSFDNTSEEYWKNIDFKAHDIQLYFNGKPLTSLAGARSYFDIANGTNGDDVINSLDIDTSIMDTCRCNIILMNGLTDYKVVNRLASKLDKLKIHLFADCPAYTKYSDTEAWKKKILNSKYIAIGAVPDKVEVSDGKYEYIYPSVNYGYIFAKMFNNYGSLNYPPAGLTYGSISASDLIVTDFELYQNELKTNRINWQRVQNEGASMWEQRTTYSLNSDLSYIAPVFIVDDLCDRIVSFERNFNFRYITPSDLLNQESGLTSILEDFETKGFLYQWKLQVPTYKEAQEAGRTLTIKVEISVTKDAEVIEIGVVLNK